MFLEISNLRKSFGTYHAVQHFEMKIDKGEFISFLGPSGCGKTTTLRMIAGFETPTTGSIRVNSQEITGLRPNQRKIGMVFQSYALFPNMTVADNVAFGLKVAKKPADEVAQRVKEMLALIGLPQLGDRYPNQLSGGQQQRVAVARALVLEPQVLLFDEPLSNLDAKLRRRVRDDIRELQQSLNLTVAYVTHDQEEALAVSDRIIVMSNARIAQTGAPRELYEEPVDLFVADFIGDANIIEGDVVDVTGPQAHVRIGPMNLHLPHRGVGRGSVKLAVRPDAILLDEASAPSGSIAGTVKKASYLGAQVEYDVESPIGDLFVVQYGRKEPIEAGTGVSISFATQRGVAIVPRA